MDMSAIVPFRYVFMHPFVSSAHNNDRIKTNLELLLPYPVEESFDNLCYYLSLLRVLGSRILVWIFMDALVLKFDVIFALRFFCEP